jgi:hypothetical protein
MRSAVNSATTLSTPSLKDFLKENLLLKVFEKNF